MQRTAIQKTQRKPIARISAKRLALLGGKLPFSTISKVGSKCISTGVRSVKSFGCAKEIARGRKSLTTSAPTAKKKRSKRIAPRKKRTTTPICSTPYPGALDPRSHYTVGLRLKLYGADKSAQREKIFERAGGMCEEIIYCKLSECQPAKKYHNWHCPNPATEWSHNRHGSNKCDCLKCGIASCTQCHRRKHSSGKETPCPSPKS